LLGHPITFPELLVQGLAPCCVRGAWLFASVIANRVVDIGASFERKLAARLENRSQTCDPAVLERNWRARVGESGAALGLPYAEAFTVLELD